jgi:hypothetical protein
VLDLNGAPGTIRTSDPQIRSLVLYPAELRARFSLFISGLTAHLQSRRKAGKVAKAPPSYRLGGRLARSGKRDLRGSSFRARASANPESRAITSGIPGSRPRRAQESGRRSLCPRPLVADAQEFHRPVRDDDPEGGPDGTFDQMNVAIMGADQFGGDRKSEPAAAGPA